VWDCNIINNGGYAFYVSACSDPTTIIVAENNWWGAADSASIEAMVYHQVDYPSAPLVDFMPFAESIFRCDCTGFQDLNADGYINPVDVVFIVNYVYLGNDMLVQPPNCHLTAGDVNCDGNVNPVDVVYYVNYVYLGNDMFCTDPCLP